VGVNRETAVAQFSAPAASLTLSAIPEYCTGPPSQQLSGDSLSVDHYSDTPQCSRGLSRRGIEQLMMNVNI
jgi:hypothetical protein